MYLHKCKTSFFLKTIILIEKPAPLGYTMNKEALLSLLILWTLHGSWQCCAMRVVDLTHRLDSDSVTWFSNSHFNLTATYMGMFSGQW